MEINVLEWIGYIASVLVAISLAMSSIVKFRWINLIGACTFSVYGFLIGALPVGFLNGLIAIIDVYFIYLIYSKKEAFNFIEVRPDNNYLIQFLDFYKKDMHKYFPDFKYDSEVNTESFFVLRNMAVAGLFLAHRENGNVLKVGLDYVIPEYRDFKNGRYIYHRLKNKFISNGFTKVISGAQSSKHVKYLKKMGFNELSNGNFEHYLEKVNR